jgi:hypothetical protein
MTYRSAAFKEYFAKVGAAPNTLNTYNSFIIRIDRALGGLDEAIRSKGPDELMQWSRTTSEPPFDTSPSHARSVLKRYLQFHIAAQGPEEETVNELVQQDEPLQTSGTIFQLEREMQSAVRKQLERLESGLTEADGGSEYTVSTGRIDVLAKGRNGKHVIIEMKAGACPAGTLEQALGYAQALSEELSITDSVRVIVVAADFSDRLRAAAKRIPEVELRKYEFSLQFKEVV